MNIRLACAAGMLLGASVFQSALAQTGPGNLPALGFEPFPTVGKEQGKDQLPEPGKKLPDKKPAGLPRLDLSEPAVQRSDLSTGYTPNMMGDVFGYFARIGVSVPGVISTNTVGLNGGLFNPPPGGGTTTGAITAARPLYVPAVAHGAFKVGENASPRPVDRVYVTYNFYNDIRSNLNGPTGPFTTTTTTPFGNRNVGGVTTTTTTLAGAPYVNLHREVFGFEKTFFDGRASVEVRLPLFQQQSSLDGFRADNMGDVTIIGKYAFLLDRSTGNVVSGGVAVTAPTGPGIATLDGTIRATLIQPWGGYIWNYNRLFLQGFHSVVIPTDQRDVSLLFNGIGVGGWLYRGEANRPISFIAPAAEVHVTTPLNHRGFLDNIYAPDMVVMTGGVHVGILGRSRLSLGVATPVSGPRVYGFEAFAQFNWRY